MRAIVMHETGGPEVLVTAEVPTPAPGPGQVLVRTEAIGLHFAETRMRSGAFLPAIPATLPVVAGIEAVGTVIEVGEGTDPALAGTTVLVGLTERSGSYAEYIAAPVGAILPVPDGVSAMDAVAVGLQGAVALSLTRVAGLAGTEQVLVEAAAGVVGGYLVQILRELGTVRIVATAGGTAKREHARALGADVVLDHRDPDWPDRVPDGLDVVFESIGGASAGRLLDALTPGTGRMVFYGMLSGEPPAITPVDLLYRGVSLIGFGGRPGTGLARIEGSFAEVLDRVAAGRIRPLVDSVLPLADAAKAHQRLEDRLATGKIILVP
jgi:NADPH:quinone reductase-like Zn-dependent oxidoreductase